MFVCTQPLFDIFCVFYSIMLLMPKVSRKSFPTTIIPDIQRFSGAKRTLRWHNIASLCIDNIVLGREFETKINKKIILWNGILIVKVWRYRSLFFGPPEIESETTGSIYYLIAIYSSSIQFGWWTDSSLFHPFLYRFSYICKCIFDMLCVYCKILHINFVIT